MSMGNDDMNYLCLKRKLLNWIQSERAVQSLLFATMVAWVSAHKTVDESNYHKLAASLSAVNLRTQLIIVI